MDPATIAIGASIASTAAGAGASYMKGAGTKAADDYQALKLDRAAEYGRTQADQVFGQLTERLNTTLGNIDAVRAAANTDPTSPTGAAYRDNQERIGERERNIKTANLIAQSDQDKADAAYYREAGNYALLQGKVGAGIGIGKAIGQGFGGGGGGSRTSGPDLGGGVWPG